MTSLARREMLELAGASVLGREMSFGQPRTRVPTSLQDWTSHQFDRGNTGYNPDATGVKSAPTYRWRFNTGDEIHTDAGAILADRRIFVPNENGVLLSLKADSGQELWRFDMEAGSVPTTPAFGDGTVFVGGAKTPLYALDYKTGKQQWTKEFPGGLFKGSPTYADGTLYAARKNLFALDGATGEVKWRNQDVNKVEGSVAIGEKLAWAYSRSEVYGVSLSDGSIVWRKALPTILQPEHFQITAADGRVYVGGKDQSVYALSAESGEQLWKFRPDQVSDKQFPARSSPAVFNGTVYVGNQDGTVYAINAEDGSEQWSFETGKRVVCSPAVADGVVYIGGIDGAFYALAADTGEEVWTQERNSIVRSSCLVSGNRVYYPTRRGFLVALEPGNTTSTTDGDAGVVKTSSDKTPVESTPSNRNAGGPNTPGESQRQRGFFTNTGDGPAALENVFNLTVLGFLLSIAGIVHQMMQG